jgi:hypothetical protein
MISHRDWVVVQQAIKFFASKFTLFPYCLPLNKRTDQFFLKIFFVGTAVLIFERKRLQFNLIHSYKFAHRFVNSNRIRSERKLYSSTPEGPISTREEAKGSIGQKEESFYFIKYSFIHNEILKRARAEKRNKPINFHISSICCISTAFAFN